MKELQQTALPRPHLLALILLLSLAAAPHAFNLAPLVIGFFFFMAGVRLWLLHRQWRLPGGPIKTLLVLIGAFNVWFHYHTLVGQSGGAALLTVMLGLKLLEVKARRDLYLTVFLSFFLIVTQFLFDQGMGIALYGLLVTLGLIALLVEINRLHPSPDWRAPLRLAALLSVQGLPILLVLFLLFPRLDAPLWRLKTDSQGRTGLSDRMTPGSIADLGQNPAVAFRVRFDGPPPEPSQRYWRGPVFLDTDGREWFAARQSPTASPRFTPLGPPLDYTVTLEPTHQRWLLALELPNGAPEYARLTSDYQIISGVDLNNGRQYRLRSYPAYRNDTLGDAERNAALRVPANVSARMRELVAGWRQGGAKEAAVVRSALLMFNRQGFVYTLTPPRLGPSPADQFLFETRQGFCEHYATSFVLLMRLAGIPARVVAGYQGGEFNDLANHLIVRQSDAHAWSEVWLSGQGWTRIDPTAAVSPERVRWSFDFEDQALSRFVVALPGVTLDASTLDYLVRHLRLTADAIDAAWGEWFLGFSGETQAALLAGLGLELWQRREVLLLMVGLAMALLSAIAVTLYRRDRRRPDPVRRAFDDLCRRLARRGVIHRPWEGPRDFTERAAALLPQRAPAIRRSGEIYLRLRYGVAGDEGLLRELRRAVRRI